MMLHMQEKKYKALSNNATGYASMVVNEMTSFCRNLNKNTRFGALLTIFGTFNT